MEAVLDETTKKGAEAPNWRVLVIDECAQSRREIGQALRSELGPNLRLWETEEAHDVLPLLDRQSIDVVLIEYPWPRRDGIDLLGEILSRGEDTVVVLLTAHGNPIVPAEALRRGADAFLSKSELQAEPLARRLGRLIAGRRLRRDAPQPLNLRELATHLHRVERCLDDTIPRPRRTGGALHHAAPGGSLP